MRTLLLLVIIAAAFVAGATAGARRVAAHTSFVLPPKTQRYSRIAWAVLIAALILWWLL